MKKTVLYWLGCVSVGLAVLTSCRTEGEEWEEQDEVQESVLINVPIRIGQSPMEIKGTLPETRSTMPMGPEQENPMRTLAVVQFDSEGNMLEINKDNSTTHPHYHFITLTSPENPSGVITADLENIHLFSSEGRNTRVCLIANETEAGIDSLLWDEQKNRRLLWNEFRVQTIHIPYKLPEKGYATDSLGHVRDIFMYGHYVGELKRSDSGVPEVREGKSLSVSLARVITRVEMNVKLGEGVSLPAGYKVFFGMYNVEEMAYLVPGAAHYLSDTRAHSHITFEPVDRTKYLTTTASTFYFYMAPHIVQEHRDEVTYFAVWCVPNTVSGEDLHNDKMEAEKNGTESRYPCAKILMCNDPLTEGDNPSAEGAFWLNRNSIYHVNLTLTYKTDSRAGGEEGYVVDLNELVKRN